MELQLENPIFAIYVNIEGMSRQRVEETLHYYNESYRRYTNATFWIFPSDKTKIEPIWNGKYQNKIDDRNLQNLIDHVNNILKVLSDGTSDASIKSQLRDLQLSKILED